MPGAPPTGTAAGWSSVIGLIVGTLSLLPFITFDEHTSYLLTIAVNIVRGIGFGALGMPLFAVAFAAVGEQHTRDVSAQMNIVQRVGGSLGTAVATVVLQQALSHQAHTPAGAVDRLPAHVLVADRDFRVCHHSSTQLLIVERRTGLRRLENARSVEVLEGVEATVESA